MPNALLLHNPHAGKNGHAEEELIALVEDAGYKCTYKSTKKKGWKQIPPGTDFIIIAGGDGTIRKVCHHLLERRVLDRAWPIALLPMGVSNNIACGLGITGKLKQIVNDWQHVQVRYCDIGRIYGLDDEEFFLEGLGFGVFPKLVREMSQLPKEEVATASKEKQMALRLFSEMLQNARLFRSELTIDGNDHTGNYLMIEIMNVSAIGSGFVLAHNADPADGKLEAVLIGDKERSLLSSFIHDRLKGTHAAYDFNAIKGESFRLTCQTSMAHTDDKLMKLKKNTPLNIGVRRNALAFLVNV